MNPDYDLRFVTLVVGNLHTYQSHFILRFTDETYNESYISRINSDGYKSSLIKCKDKVVKFLIYDTDPKQREKLIEADGIFVLYSVTDKESFDFARMLVQKYKESGLPNKIVLVGTKEDLRSERQVSFKEGEDFANSFSNKIPFIEVSSRTGENVDNAFKLMFNSMYKSYSNVTNNELLDISDNIEKLYLPKASIPVLSAEQKLELKEKEIYLLIRENQNLKQQNQQLINSDNINKSALSCNLL